MIPPEEPSQRPTKKRWIPQEMTTAPKLANAPTSPIQQHYALLINPFYPKDPHASFGKHVLTPTLALTSFAAATPEHWRVENLDEKHLVADPPLVPHPPQAGLVLSTHL